MPVSTRVLIAEDSKVQADMLCNLLVDAGYQVRVAHDGAQALQMAREQPPRFVAQ